MIKQIFADTSGLLPYLDSRQNGHDRALHIVRGHMAARGRFVTTNYVLTELLALFTTRTPLRRAEIFAAIDAVQQSPSFEIVHITPELHREALALLRARPDKKWSWVDAASFVVMQHRNIADALATDHHFEQAGFVALLKAGTTL